VYRLSIQRVGEAPTARDSAMTTPVYGGISRLLFYGFASVVAVIAKSIVLKDTIMTVGIRRLPQIAHLQCRYGLSPDSLHSHPKASRTPS